MWKYYLKFRVGSKKQTFSILGEPDQDQSKIIKFIYRCSFDCLEYSL